MTAKELFLKSEDASAVAKFLDSLPFQRAAETALLQFAGQMKTGNNEVTQAAANHFRMEGAQQVIFILQNLCKVDLSSEKRPIGQLKHDLK